MNGRYLTLAGRIRREIKDLEQVVQRSQTIYPLELQTKRYIELYQQVLAKQSS